MYARRRHIHVKKTPILVFVFISKLIFQNIPIVNTIVLMGVRSAKHSNQQQLRAWAKVNEQRRLFVHFEADTLYLFTKEVDQMTPAVSLFVVCVVCVIGGD
jgi:hypothetical protein